MHPEVHADHVTILWGPEIADLESPDLGSIVQFSVIGYAEDRKAQAVVVILPPKIGAMVNRTPHITVSTAPGVAPAYSNEMLHKGFDRVARRTYTGIVDFSKRQVGAPSLFFPLAHRVATSWLRQKLRDV